MLVDPGWDLPSSRTAVDLAAQHPGRVFAAVGIHPHDASTATEEALAELRQLAGRPGVVAIGETGLDYYRMLSPREQQLRSLEQQLALARECGLPVILHNRDSHADLMALLREHGRGLRGVFHCFAGDRQMAEDCLSFDGFSLSFSGPLTYRANAAWPKLPRGCPWGAYWSRPTAPISRRILSGGGATNQSMLPLWPRSWPSYAASPLRRLRISPRKMRARYLG